MARWRWLSLVLVAGCEGGDAGAPDLHVAGPDLGSPACPNDLPATCPSPAPSWNAQIAPLVLEKCAPCHSVGGLAPTKPLDDYDAVYARRGAVLNQVYACSMPPPDGGTLDQRERAALLGWLVCSAPDN